MEEVKKHQRYQRLYIQIADIIKPHNDDISRMATIVAILHNKMNYFFWTGFYLLKNNRLMVGPYQGAVACIELQQNKGVCWAAIQQQKTIIVPNVHSFEGHIACDARSKSEIVVPIFNKSNTIIGVLDIDSKEYNSFSEADKQGLEKIIELFRN